MQLYNTATTQVSELMPQSPPDVRVYTCGPTVYDYAHIGHWFTYIRADFLIRTLKASGLTPIWVINITDVGHLVSDGDEGEDKLEKGARREGKTAWEVAEFYTQDFLSGMQQLNITNPTHLPKATDHIREQIALIQRLEAKEYTYRTDDGIYFDTARFPRYADFARLNLAQQQAGARVEVNDQKRQPSDFALWKFSSADSQRDMEWGSPWGTGWPGWHIECSAMSMRYLGATLDIHTGGIDHIPVHHTNEIAQSEAATDQPFARHWLHSNHILINGEKISKSLNNGIRLDDIHHHELPVLALRLYALESHYRKQATFSWEGLAAATKRLRNYQAMADLRYQLQAESNHDFSTWSDELLAAASDDLDSPRLLASLSQQADILADELVGENQAEEFTHYLERIDGLLGLGLLTSSDVNAEQQHILASRAQARNEQDWQVADHYREQLASLGVGVRDTASGQVWFRA